MRSWRETIILLICVICKIPRKNTIHYNDVIMGAIASQITSLTIVYSTVYSGADQRKHQSSASLAFVWGIHRGPVNSLHKWPVTREMCPFDDVIMQYKTMTIFDLSRDIKSLYNSFVYAYLLLSNIWSYLYKSSSQVTRTFQSEIYWIILGSSCCYCTKIEHDMMTSSNGNIFRVTGHLCGEFTGPRWIPHTEASDAELWCFLWFASE